MFELKILTRDFPCDKSCIDYFWLRFLWFSFRWFLDCGEWFVYVEIHNKRRTIGYRFSSAGNMPVNHKNDDVHFWFSEEKEQ
jgi:hypothetical protein